MNKKTKHKYADGMFFNNKYWYWRSLIDFSYKKRLTLSTKIITISEEEYKNAKTEYNKKWERWENNYENPSN